MAAEILGGAMDDIVRAESAGTDEIGSREGVVDGQPCSIAMSELSEGGEIGDAEQGVRNGLAEDETDAAALELLLNLIKISDVDERRFHTEWPKHRSEQGDCLTVEVTRGDNAIACLDTGEDGGVQSCHT